MAAKSQAKPASREQALDMALAQIDKAFGKGSVMRLGDDTRPPVEVIPTGSIALDVALGVGGLPRGRVVEIYGPESSGKTTVALHAIAQAQKAGGIAAFSGFAPQLLNAGGAGETLFMVLGFILLGLSFGQSSGAVTNNFPKRARYTGAALTSDLAWLFGAGFAPLAALFLADRFGLVAAGGYLLSGAIGTLLALGLNLELARRLD
mgnify:CR=1 FL=1